MVVARTPPSGELAFLAREVGELSRWLQTPRPDSFPLPVVESLKRRFLRWRTLLSSEEEQVFAPQIAADLRISQKEPEAFKQAFASGSEPPVAYLQEIISRWISYCLVLLRGDLLGPDTSRLWAEELKQLRAACLAALNLGRGSA